MVCKNDSLVVVVVVATEQYEALYNGRLYIEKSFNLTFDLESYLKLFSLAKL
jgi:hypothetical protein